MRGDMAYGPSLKKPSRKKPILVGLLIVGLLAVLAVGGWYGYKYLKARSVKDPAGAKIQKTNIEDVAAEVNDNQTPTPSVIQTPPGQTPAAESSTAITITSPAAGARNSGGTKLEGTAPNVRTVNYRIQSDDRGLIGQGELAVINGRYSGSVAVNGASGSGFIEVFVFDTEGREQKHSKVEVNF